MVIPPDDTPPTRAPRLTRRGLGLGVGVALSGTAVAAAGAHVGRAPGLPRLSMGRHGVVRRGGAPFRAGGVNAFQLVTNDYPRPRLMTPAEIDALITRAVALDAGFLRAHTLAASVGGPHCLVRGVSGHGRRPTIHYDPAVWRTIDYAIWRARRAGLYLIAPLVDEWGYYNGGKRTWVDFRRPGSVSLDPAVTAGNSARQRSAEDAFYSDRQVRWDFEQFVRTWLHHVNPFTRTAYRDEPVLSLVQVGNELWTAAQDAPGWVDATAALVKRESPGTLVMDSGADGLDVTEMAWASPHVDVLETHPYDVFGADDVTAMARFAAGHGKAFAVGEYAWSKTSAPAVEAAVRRTPTILTSAPWSLQNDADRHAAGAPYGGDDVSLYVPGEDDVQRAAVRRITALHRAMREPSAR